LRFLSPFASRISRAELQRAPACSTEGRVTREDRRISKRMKCSMRIGRRPPPPHSFAVVRSPLHEGPIRTGVGCERRGRGGAGDRARLSTPPQLEPDRARSRCRCSLVPLLACPCNARVRNRASLLGASSYCGPEGRKFESCWARQRHSNRLGPLRLARFRSEPPRLPTCS